MSENENESEICKKVRDELALDVRPPEEGWVRDHLRSCEECARFLTKLQALERELGTLGDKDVSDETVGRLLQRPELQRRPSVRWRAFAGVAAAAALAAIILSRSPLFLGRKDLPVGSGVAEVQPSEQLQAEVKVQPGKGEPKDERDRASAAPAPESEGAGGIVSLTGPVAASKENDEKGMAFRQAESNSVDKLAEVVGRTGKSGRGDESGQKKDSQGAGGRVEAEPSGSALYLRMDQNAPAKRMQKEPIYPERAKQARVEGTVVVEVTVDREGNVTDARIVQSIPLLDQAALDAVREWKYEPSDSPVPRRFPVAVEFRLPEQPKEPDPSSARLFLEERARVEGLSYREARGYWANTYVPGDPLFRRLASRLGKEAPELPHREARPASLPLDPSSTSALSLTLHADRPGITGKSRLLVEVGIRAADRESRRRPPMNVAVLLDLPAESSPEAAAAAGALLRSLESAREPGDRFHLIATGSGGGEILSPDEFRHGPLLVALQDLEERGSDAPATPFTDALALAYEKVLAEDDPTEPLGTSLVLVIPGRALGEEIEGALRLASQGAIGGVSLSAVGIGASALASEAERLALAGQGRSYALTQASEAASIVDRELAAGSRTVARAVRLRIQLAEGVRLVNVLGSAPLSAREAERTRSEERAIDVRLARNLGIEADRGKDEDGIQIVVPAFYAGDSHSVLLDVVAEGAGPIAEVTARYKDLIQLQNTVAGASLALSRSEAAPGPLETSVLKDYLDFLVSQALRDSSSALGRSDLAEAGRRLEKARGLLSGLSVVVPALYGDRDVERDVVLLDRYERLVARAFDPNALRNLHDSLLYASALKRLWHPLS